MVSEDTVTDDAIEVAPGKVTDEMLEELLDDAIGMLELEIRIEDEDGDSERVSEELGVGMTDEDWAVDNARDELSDEIDDKCLRLDEELLVHLV